MKRRAWPVAAGLLYIAAVAALGGLRADHVIIGLLGFLDLYNEKTRSFLALFFPFILTGVIYDSMRYYYWPAIQGRVHVREPYRLELSWFGIDGRTPNEWMDAHRSVLLDLACGPGGWVMEWAATYPHIEAWGVDISTLMIEYAQQTAQAAGLTNAHFLEMDVSKPLDSFADQSFDLVNVRYLIGFLPAARWPALRWTTTSLPSSGRMKP